MGRSKTLINNDVVNIQYNDKFVVEDIYHDKYGHKIYKLKCMYCDRIIDTRNPNGSKLKCECETDLTDRNIGFLHINKLIEDNKRKDRRLWSCSCLCGKDISMYEQAILRDNGVPKSCGCVNKANYLVDQIFGNLKVVKYLGKQNNNLIWLCECVCGNNEIKTSYQLRNGKKLSCNSCTHNVEYVILDNYVECLIKGTDIKFYIDTEDYCNVSRHNWYYTDNGYIKCSDGYLHRIVMDAKQGEVVDHINHDKLNNMKANLRKVSYSQNSMNSIYQKNELVGVSKSGKSTWRARIYKKNGDVNLGTFGRVEDAIAARRDAEDKYFGEYSYRRSVNGGNVND